MKIYPVQMNVVPGKPELNFETLKKEVEKAVLNQCDLVVFPEMCLSGYLIGDLWEEHSFLDQCVEYGNRVASLSNSIDILFGNVAREDGIGENGRPFLYNAAFYASKGRFEPLIHSKGIVKHFLPKTLLPCYREFDEPRYFSDLRRLAFSLNQPLEALLKPYTRKDGIQIGISICEDAWDSIYEIKPVSILASQMNENGFLINISCSPFTLGKTDARHRVFAAHASQNKIPLLYLNSVGTQNNGKNIYAFEGDSCFYRATGEKAFEYPKFESYSTVIELDGKEIKVSEKSKPQLTGMAEVRKALVYMLSENLKRWGIERVVIGASGGIDSAVSAVLYTEALGADRVFLVNMPTRFNSKTTRNAAKDLADNLGCPYLEAPITDTIDVFCRGLSSLSFERSSASLKVEGIHYENLQARTRSATFLATIASVLNAAFTCNGNKSEVMTGYCTLYGDTCGIVCALGDLWKTQVYELAREINKEREIIPEASILIPASAELSDAQNVDEGKGDPIVYAYHDKLFSFWMERWNRNSLGDSIMALKDGSLYEKLSISKDFFDSLFKSYEDAIADMKYWWGRYKGIALAKRIQMPPVLCVSRRAFGFDLRESQI